VVVPFAARGLKRQKFLLNLQFIVFTDKVTVTKLHLSLIRHFNFDKLINRRIKLVKQRILTTPAAIDMKKFTGVEVACIKSQQMNLESRAV
jgi:hypothetical protein